MKTTFVFLFVFLNVFILKAQPKSENTTINIPKLYLHTDREFYFSGDTLWFAAYYLDGKTNTFKNESCNLYSEIINKKGEIVLSEKFILQNGFCSGYISLSDSINLEGNYLLRVYTDYLKNFGNDAFFTKTIRISTVKNSLDLMTENKTKEIELRTQNSPAQSASDSIHQLNQSQQVKNKIDVSFLPEGGFLLADESNCVTFKAVNENGLGKNISGKLLDEDGNLVLNFKSIYKGSGKFYFYPKPGKKYTAKIDGFPELEFPLPKIRETGAKIKLVNQEDERIQMVIQAKNIKYPIQLLCLHRGKILSELEIDKKKANSFLRLSTRKLGSGINRFVLLDKNSNPLSERLVFHNDNSIYEIEVGLNEESFSTREEVQQNINASNLTGEMAQVSVSVVDENYVNASGISQNIASYLLLDSELKGHIDSPADYFNSEDSISSQTKLDLLMCVNGWSNYIWNNPAPDSIRFKPQLGFTFTGNVKRFTGKKALSEGNVSMILFKNDSTSEFFDQPLDLNGNFEFRNIVFYDSASVFVQARNKRESHNLKFDLKLPEIISPQIYSSDILQLKYNSDIPVSVYRKRYLNEMRLKEFYPEKDNILLEEVDVTAKKPKPKFKTGVPRKNDGPFKLTWEMTAGTTNLLEYLAYRVPGVKPIYDSGELVSVSVAPGAIGGGAAFFQNDFNYLPTNVVQSLNISDIKTVEIITPPTSNIYGARAINGAIIFTFKRGDEIDATLPLFGGTVKRIKGFTPLREFYSPKYTPENINAEAPDYRNTLHWNPKVNITEGGQELSFFTCDNVSRYKVFVEGITESGKICLGTSEFEVNRFNNSASE